MAITNPRDTFSDVAYKQMRIDRDHPFAIIFGVERPRGRPVVYEHKYLLYMKLGPGSHPCHWCGKDLQWRRGTADGTLLVDHLDGDHTNNVLSNLAPSCNGCNTIRGRTKNPAITPSEATVEYPDGSRTRAISRSCEICEKEFLVEPIRVEKKSVRVCSNSCAGRLGARARWGR